ncbi:MAG TPA: glycosyltransferase family 2 protein [Ignavibacteria bacterium]
MIDTKKMVSVVVPVYHNEGSLLELYTRFCKLAEENGLYDFEFIFVDDNSGDSSYSVLKTIFDTSDKNIKIIRLSKNHGSFNAALAGLSKSKGDCSVIIAADLQDPPELIATMISEWKKGNQVVMAARNSRQDPIITKLFAKIYYKFLRKLALKDMPEGGFDFVLIDRKIVNILCETKEKNTSLMGLILWTGFKRSILYYNRKARPYGKSMWIFTKKLKYFIDSFVAFSFTPIRFMTIIGFIISITGFLYAIFLMYDRLINKNLIQGITALIVIVLFLGGIQLIMLGIIGEYLWRILDETRKRPVFIIDEYLSKDITNE